MSERLSATRDRLPFIDGAVEPWRSSVATPLKLSIVIPVYNERNTIGQVLAEVGRVELGLIEKEIIVSDDGSTDGSVAIARRYAEQHPDMVKVHSAPVNRGKGAAIHAGMDYATGNLVIIQDADLELNPREYGRILEPLVSGRVDVVYGSRFLAAPRGIPLCTRLANRFLTWLTNVLFGVRLTDMETAYKAFGRSVWDALDLRCMRFDFEPEITAQLLLAGYAIHEVPVSYRPRSAAEGKKICWLDGLRAIRTLLRCRFSGVHTVARDG